MQGPIPWYTGYKGLRTAHWLAHRFYVWLQNNLTGTQILFIGDCNQRRDDAVLVNENRVEMNCQQPCPYLKQIVDRMSHNVEVWSTMGEAVLAWQHERLESHRSTWNLHIFGTTVYCCDYYLYTGVPLSVMAIPNTARYSASQNTRSTTVLITTCIRVQMYLVRYSSVICVIHTSDIAALCVGL